MDIKQQAGGRPPIEEQTVLDRRRIVPGDNRQTEPFSGGLISTTRVWKNHPPPTAP